MNHSVTILYIVLYVLFILYLLAWFEKDFIIIINN